MAISKNNLKAVIDDTANAIRSKTGSSSEILPRNFADTISSITKVEYTPQESADVISKLYSGTLVNAIVPDDVTSLHPYLFYQMSSLVSVDFNNVVTIPMDCCYGCSNLTTITFSTNTTRIENSAFQGCNKLADISIPHTITYIGNYAFSNVGSYYSTGTHAFEFIDDVGVETSIGVNAFDSSHLSKFVGVVSYCSNYAFYACASLTYVDINFDNCSIGAQAFNGCSNIQYFNIDSSSVITNLGSSAFQTLALNTYTTATIYPFDFRNSIFTSLPSDVWNSCKFNGVVYFPTTLSSITGNFLNSATGNWTLYFNSIPSVSNSSYLRNDTSTFTVKYCFAYELIDTASSTTNWSSHTSQMVAYGTGYAQGATLPEYTRTSGVGISWFSDIALTTPITTSASASDVYYCTLGSTRLVWFVNTLTLIDSNITISDGVNTYSANDPILVNTSITITPSASDNTKPILYMLLVNGTDYTSSGSATITMTQNLDITAIYWDGVNLPFLPTLSDNSWGMLQLASKTNSIPATWQVGDTKTFTYNGITHTARLVDKTGKYNRVSDNSVAYLKFECTDLIEESVAYSSSNNIPTNSSLLTDMNSGTIYGKIDSDIVSVIEPVKVKVSQGGGSSTENTLIDYEAKFFLQREHDLFDTRTYSVQAEWNAISAQDEWYQTHNTNADRIKAYSGTNKWYWEMSARSGDSGSVCGVDGDGYAYNYSYGSTGGVALVFAL